MDLSDFEDDTPVHLDGEQVGSVRTDRWNPDRTRYIAYGYHFDFLGNNFTDFETAREVVIENYKKYGKKYVIRHV